MSAELKDTIENLGKAFEEFKKENDQRLEEISKKGAADPLLTEKVDKINKDVGEFAELKKRLDEMETKGNRPGKTAEAVVGEHQKAYQRFLRKGQDDGLGELQQKAVNVGTDADGGYAVPEQLDTEIAQIERQNAPMRGVARVIPVSNEEYKKLVNLGGAGSGWVGEQAARAETSGPSLAQLAPFFGEIYANPAATQKSLDDVMFSVEQWLADEVGIEFAEKENAAYTSGDGVSKPKGILAYPLATTDDSTRAFGTIQKRHSGTAGDFDGDDLINLIHDLRRGYRNGGQWMMSNLTFAKARKLKDGNGDYLWRPGLEAGSPDVLLGYGVVENDDMPDVAADANAIMFANYQRGYYIVDVRGTRVLRDPYTNKPFVHFYTTKRVGGMVVDSNAIKVLTLSL